MNFKLIIKDYDNSNPLKDKEIQITNIDSKKCYESKFTTTNGEVLFEIPQNERGDFFSVKLINDNDYEVNPYYLAKESNTINSNNSHRLDSNNATNKSKNTHKNAFDSNNLTNPNTIDLAHTNNTKSQESHESKNTTNKILTPNNYQKCPATLYFKAKIYLYFNGFTLFVMQGDKAIASYESYTNTTLENGTYFIDTQEIKDLIATYESNESNKSVIYESNKSSESIKSNHSKHTSPHNNESSNSNNSNNTDDSNNADSTQSIESNTNLSLNVYNNKDFTQTHCKICNSTQNAIDDNIIYSNHFFTNIGKITTLINIMQYVKCIIDYKPNLIKSIKIERHNDSVFADINAPFAVGTYLSLEAIQQQNDTINDAGALNTIYWKEELHAKKSNAKHFKIISHKSRETFIIGQCTQNFYLSTPKELDYLRQNGYVEFTYIIYASSIKYFDKNTTHIKFNLNFEVGIGADNAVREIQRDAQSKMQNGNILNSDDINEWNQLSIFIA